MTLNLPRQAVEISSRPGYSARYLCLHNKQTWRAHLLHESFIYLEGITPSPGYFKVWIVSDMTAALLDQKLILSRTSVYLVHF